MSNTMDAQEEGRFGDMSDRDKEIQASIWALLFLVSELSLAFRTLRDVLQDREALRPEDQDVIDKLASQEDRMRIAYEHVEQAFRQKYVRVIEAIENPEEVTRQMEVAQEIEKVRQTIDVSPEEKD